MKLRLVAALALALGTGCGKGLTSETGPCLTVSGSYQSAWSNTCSKNGAGTGVTLTQNGCRFAGTIPELGAVEGTIVDDAASLHVTLSGACTGTLTGTASVTSTRIQGTFSGDEAGTGCCTSLTGTLTLSR